MPEGRAILKRMTVFDNLRMGAYVRSDAEVARDIDAVFERFPVLGERRSQMAGTLSGGEQQMLAIGRALVARPRLLLLDEPSLGLAPKFVTRIFLTLRELKQEGKTILLVEQNARQALQVADTGYVMERGRIRAQRHRRRRCSTCRRCGGPISGKAPLRMQAAQARRNWLA